MVSQKQHCLTQDLMIVVVTGPPLLGEDLAFQAKNKVVRREQAIQRARRLSGPLVPLLLKLVSNYPLSESLAFICCC